MPYFSKRSKEKLEPCHEDIKLICHHAILDTDFSVTCGHRTKDAQMELFKQGRKLINGIWIIEDKSRVITYKDGIKKLSKHNFSPAMAFDAIPFPVDWEDINRFFYLSNVLKETARFLLNLGKIKHRLVWGGDWKMKDYPHFQLEDL